MNSEKVVPQVQYTQIITVVTLMLGFIASVIANDSSNGLISVNRLKQVADLVNSADTTWSAEVSYSLLNSNENFIDVKHLTGSFDPRFMPKEGFLKNNGDDDAGNCCDSSSEEDDKKWDQCENNGLPKSFDARQHWPKCTSIDHIYDQGNCGSCWAVGTTSVFTDRLCIQSKAKHTQLRSVQQVLSCCHKGVSKDGCQGGWPDAAFDYMRRVGVATGGDYDSHEGCQPYRVKPCAHHVNGTKLPLCSSMPDEKANKCKLHCYNGKYRTAFKKDRVKVKKVNKIDPCSAMGEIYKRGPITAAFAVYEDFYVYKSGVYQYTTGKLRGWHVVRVIGWGEEKGTPYWLAANSWNKSWGNNGSFKIIRGPTGNAWFEEHMVTISFDS